jgi:hypothetical protein
VLLSSLAGTLSGVDAMAPAPKAKGGLSYCHLSQLEESTVWEWESRADSYRKRRACGNVEQILGKRQIVIPEAAITQDPAAALVSFLPP